MKRSILVMLLLWPIQAMATVLFSDDFDATPLWDGCPNVSAESAMPDWSAYFNSWTCGNESIVDDGGGNHVLKFTWPQDISSLGPGIPETYTDGLGQVYIGFNWRHDAGWDWGTDAVHKWVYFPQTGGERSMMNIQWGRIRWIDGVNGDADMTATNGPSTESAEWLGDEAWHNVVFFVAPATDTIRAWWDGTEITWSEDNIGGAPYAGSTFDSGPDATFVIGYQSRDGWGVGNASYFDRVILATTKAEVDAYLGGITPPTELPPPVFLRGLP